MVTFCVYSDQHHTERLLGKHGCYITAVTQDEHDVVYVKWAGGICLICIHKPKRECGHTRQIPTTHVTYAMYAM